MNEGSLAAKCGLRNFDSSEFFFDGVVLVRSSIELRLIKIALNGQALKSTKQLAAKASFFGFPWINAETISFCINGLGSSGTVVCRICREGSGTPWEYRDFTVNGDRAFNVSNFFSSLHRGFRIEIIDSAGLTVGQKLILRLECPQTTDRECGADNRKDDPLVRLNAPPQIAPSPYPRLLIVDSTPVGSESATGQIKQVFLEGWPIDCLIQVYEESGTLKLKRWADNDGVSGMLTEDELLAACRQFRPDAIYFRPVDSEKLFNFVVRVVTGFPFPLVVHMMDDWPERLKADDPETFAKLDPALRQLLSLAGVRLSICQMMSNVYLKRYGHQFVPLANGVDVDITPLKDWSRRMAISEKRPFLIRYMGALAEDMTFDSVVDIAKAVSVLTDELHVRFEIYTMSWCLQKSQSALSGLRGVHVSKIVPAQDYVRFLSEADALVIAYNFDARSIRYIGLSMANKMPELLASGAAVIAYGPSSVPTISYLEKEKCARVVSQRSSKLLSEEIKFLVTHLDACRDLGLSAREHARRFLNKNMVKDSFHTQITRAINNGSSIGQLLMGPYSRANYAHYDETDCIADLLSNNPALSTMFDVGAHHGWALTPFVKKGWKIYAFEPDENNRAKLYVRIAKLNVEELVKVDSRAVSQESRVGLAFYRSEVSTGISGLSAFHPSHRAEQIVDTVTLTEALAGEALSAVDFLKIDTEGYDLFVLKGFPWNRFSPAVIECKFEDSKTVPLGYTFHDLAKYLVEKGYRVYVSEWHPIIRYDIRHDWHCLVRYPSELTDAKGWGKLLAFRDPIDEAVLVAAVRKLMKMGAEPGKAEQTAYRVSPGPFQQLAPTGWRYLLPEGKGGSFWIAEFNFPVHAGQALVGGLTIESDRDMQVRVTLGRNGDSLYEGTPQTLLLSPATAQSVVLEHVFARQHASVKVQLEVMSLKGKEANLSISQVFANERPAIPTVALPVAPTVSTPPKGPAVIVAPKSPLPIPGAARQTASAGAPAAVAEKAVPLPVAPTVSTPPKGPAVIVVPKSPLPIPQAARQTASAGAPAAVAEKTVALPKSPLALAIPSPSAHTSVPVMKPVFAERIVVQMHQPIEGNNWSAPVRIEGDTVRWAAAGERATLTLPVQRDRDMLVVVACHPAGAEDRLDGLRVEIDGVAVPHTLHRDINPTCILVPMPARTEAPHTATELALLVPAAAASAPVAGKPVGLAVAAVFVLPTRPDNTANPEIPGPRWSRRLIGLVDRRGKRTLPFPFSHFDGVTYLAENPDVAETVLAGRMPSALFHYQRYGFKEKRRAAFALTRNPNEGGLADMFNGLAYLDTYPDVAATVRSEAMPSALEHYVTFGRKERRQVRTCFDGSVCRGTALDLVRLEASREAKAGLDGVTLQLSKDITAQIGQLASRLTKIETAVSGLAPASDLEVARAEFLKDLALCARTAELQAVRQDLSGALDGLRQEADKRAGQLAGEIRDRFSTAARAADVVRVEQATAQTMERLRARIGELERTEQLTKDRLERLHAEMETVREELEAKAGALRRELQGGLAERARTAELEQMEQRARARMDQWQAELEAVRGELGAKAVALRQELEQGLGERAPADDLERMEILTRERLERLHAELETVRGALEANAGTLRQELEQGLEERARRGELERVEDVALQHAQQLHSDLEVLKGALEANTGALRQELEQGLEERARHDELERVEQHSRDRMERLQGDLAALGNIRDARESALAAQLEAMKAGFELAKAKVELADVKQSSLQRDMEHEAGKLLAQMSGVDTRLSSADASVRKLSEDLDQVQKQQATQQSRLTHPNLYAFNVLGYQAFARQLTMANAGRLAKHWGPLLGLTVQENEMFYLAHRICNIENVCLGRLATSIDSVLLRTLVARAASSKAPEVLEIGTLFGLGIIAVHEAIAPFFARVHFTGIDPLEGYYGKAHRDIVTGVPVSRAVFNENLRRAGISFADVTVIQHLSTDAMAMTQAHKTRYGLLIIDGDHRYGVVKHDLESYLDTVVPRGYVIFDDYGNPSWPDVKSYVDAEVMGRKDLEFLGSDWRTAVFRVAGVR